MPETPEVTLTPSRLACEPEFIDLNDLERLCNDGRFVKALCVWSTTVKRGERLGRCGGSELHFVKDWFALLPNDEARAFASWLLDLAAAAWHERFDGEYSPAVPKVSGVEDRVRAEELPEG